MPHRFEVNGQRFLTRLRVRKPSHFSDVDGIASCGRPMAFHKDPPVGGKEGHNEPQKSVAYPLQPFFLPGALSCQEASCQTTCMLQFVG